MRTVVRSISSALLLAASAAGTSPAIHPSLSALCPKATPGEIVVCGDRDPPPSQYRIPTELPRPPEFGTRESDSVSRERNALLDYDSGGAGSCSPSGAAGVYGCQFRQFKRQVEQRAHARDPRGHLYDDPRK